MQLYTRERFVQKQQPKYCQVFFQARSLNLLDQRTVDAPSINAFKSIDCSTSGTTGWAYSRTSPLSRPCWLHRLPVMLHKVYHKIISVSALAADKSTLKRIYVKNRSELSRVCIGPYSTFSPNHKIAGKTAEASLWYSQLSRY